MSQQPIETGVVLTTDNSQYDQAMTQSASTTDQLGASVDQLAGKLSSLSKSAGRKMVGIAAADLATITAATAAYGAFEKQMTALTAQAAVLNRNYDAGKRLADSYARSVNGLRREFGTTTSEATSLVQVISKMSDHTASIDKLAVTFTKMGNATQESSTGLASSVLQLQKTMGTSQKDTEKYANSLTVLAANSNTSATAIADFAQQIAPVGRLVGQSQADIQGVATAFLKAGQDGYRAGTVYNKVLSDIAYATQSGSPELQKYANFVGMTVNSFKELSGTEKILAFFNQVNKLGPDAISTINRMGLDGASTIKSIQAVAQSGGLPTSIAQSRAAMNDNAIGRGSASAMDDLTTALAKLRSQLTMTAEAFGEKFAPIAQKFIESITKMADVARKMIDGPFGDLAAMFAGLVATLGSLGGGILIAAPLLAKLAGVAFLTRGAGTLGMRAGFTGASGPLAPGEPVPGGTRPLSWFQRGQFNALNMMGSQAARIPGLTGFVGGPNDPRGPMWQRTIAGGMNVASFGTRNLLAPLFSPLGLQGYNDPGARSRLFNDPRNPLTQMRDAFRGVPGDQRGPLSQFGSAFRERVYGLPYARGALGLPGSGAMSIDPGTSLFDKDVRVTDQGRVTSGAAKAAASSTLAANAAMTRQTTALSAAFANASRSAGVLAGSMASAAANTALLAGKGLGGLAKAGAGSMPMVGMAALVGGSALGVESNALTLGAMGAMFGSPMMAGAGAAVGFGIDVYSQNKEYDSLLKGAAQARKEGTLTEQFQANQGIFAERDKVLDLPDPSKLGYITPPIDMIRAGASPKDIGTILKLQAGSLWAGEDIIGKRLDEGEKAEKSQQDAVSAIMALASERGQPIESFDFTSQSDFEKLDTVLASVQPQMEKLGITGKDIIDAWTESTPEDNGSWLSMLNMLADPSKFTGLEDRIANLGAVGRGFTMSLPVKAALAAPESENAQLKAIDSELARVRGMGLSTAQIVTEMGNIRATAGEASDPNYIIAAGVQAQAQRELGYRMPMMTRTQRFGEVAALFDAQRGVKGGDEAQQANMLAATEQMQATIAESDAYFRNQLLQQREFKVSQDRAEIDFGVTRERMDYQYNISRERAQEDYAITRAQQEEDYHLSRFRAEEDYNIARERGQQAYHRSMRRAQQDFNISRRRQEQDFQHSVEMMVEQQAKSMYSVYDRVKVEASSSANFLLFNAGDQLNRMQKQAADLERLRGAGISDDVIQQLGLGDAANAQQLARFVAEVAGNPEMVAEFNKMVRKRLKAAAELVKDESSTEWQEFVRQFKLARERAGADFDRQVARSHRDFKRGMNEMEQDFRRSMNRMAHDYETAQDRQQEAFSRSMKRGAEDYAVAVNQMTEDFNKAMMRAQRDLNRMAREITGTYKEILTRSVTELHGIAQAEARIVLEDLDRFGIRFNRRGELIMEDASDVFGFDYKGPRGSSNTNPNMHNQGNFGSGPGAAAGGVLQAPRSIGTDNMHFSSKEHGNLNLAGGEAIMVPEWVDMVGGPNVVNDMNQRARKGYAGGGNIPAVGDWNQHTSDYAWAKWAGDINVPGSGDYGNPVRAYKPGTVSDVQRWGHSYGNHIRINHPESEEQTLYAHLSKILVNVLDKVTRGEQIGNVGETGKAFGPHLHFEIKGGTGPVNVGGGGGTTISLASILKDRYPEVENAAAAVAGGNFFPDGWPSKKLNKMARQAFRDRVGQVSPHAPGVDDVQGASGSNQEIVKAVMHAFGWNQWPSLYQLVMHESGFNNTAQNPTSTAYGMFQFLDSTWAGVGGHKTSDPQLQALYGMRYIRNRYNDPKGAWDFWQANNWYGDGAIFSGAQQVGVGERGPELALPLNNGGANFLSSLFEKIYVGTEAKQTNVRHSQAPAGQTHTTYQIDRSTTFTGDITVKANSPHDLVHQLKARQRTYALAQQSLGGVRA